MVVEQVTVAHPLLDVVDVHAGCCDGLGAEGVAQVVEAQRPHAGGLLDLAVAAAEGRAVHRAGLGPGKHSVVGQRVELGGLDAPQEVE